MSGIEEVRAALAELHDIGQRTLEALAAEHGYGGDGTTVSAVADAKGHICELRLGPGLLTEHSDVIGVENAVTDAMIEASAAGQRAGQAILDDLNGPDLSDEHDAGP